MVAICRLNKVLFQQVQLPSGWLLSRIALSPIKKAQTHQKLAKSLIIRQLMKIIDIV